MEQLVRPSFADQLKTKFNQGKFLCIGLDPDTEKLPDSLSLAKNSGKDGFYARQEIYWKFLRPIIDATAGIVCAYKPNIAFYEGIDVGGYILNHTLSYIRTVYPDIPIIGDFKRADITNTNKGYARSAYDFHQVDAVTTNPYFGSDTYPPFTKYPGKGLISMVKTSNPGSGEYQDLIVNLRESVKMKTASEDELKTIKDLTGRTNVPQYWLVAYRHGRMSEQNPNIGIVVGATHPEAFKPVRRLYGDGYILIPGIGTQGGDLEKTMMYAPNKDRQGIIINSSSGILYASHGDDFVEAAYNAANKLDKQIRATLS